MPERVFTLQHPASCAFCVANTALSAIAGAKLMLERMVFFGKRSENTPGLVGTKARVKIGRPCFGGSCVAG